MITLANTEKEFLVTDKIINKYKSSFPAVIYGYIKSLGDGMHKCTIEDLGSELWITESVQNKWIKALVKDKLIDVEYRGLHNKRFLGCRNAI